MKGNYILTLEIHPFSTSMIMGGRVTNGTLIIFPPVFGVPVVSFRQAARVFRKTHRCPEIHPIKKLLNLRHEIYIVGRLYM